MSRTVPHAVHGQVKVKIRFIGKIAFTDEAPLIEALQEIKTQVANLTESESLSQKVAGGGRSRFGIGEIHFRHVGG